MNILEVFLCKAYSEKYKLCTEGIFVRTILELISTRVISRVIFGCPNIITGLTKVTSH